MRSGDFAAAVAADLAVVHALGEALAGTGKPLVGTSGTLTVAQLGRTGTDQDSGEAVTVQRAVRDGRDTHDR